MKKYFTILSLALITFFASYSFKNASNTGMAGYTGSPGETTCTSCHGGGSSSSAGLTISAVPAFTNNQYMADSTYQINIQVGAVGFSRFGFDAEILDSLQNNAGTMQLAGTGVKFQTIFNGRKNAVHTTKKTGTNLATFSFQWIAPSSGKVEIYACGNAVNNNNTTTGDLPIPGSLELYPAPLPPQDTSIFTAASNRPVIIQQVSVYPNPASEKLTVSYFLKSSKKISIRLTSINGSESYELFNQQQEAGVYSQIVQLPPVTGGIYFLRIDAGGKQVTNKLVSVH